MYKLKLMFEWGGGTIWSDCDTSLSHFGLGPIEDTLPISQEILLELQQLTEIHDGALDWEYPPNQSPWSVEEFENFEVKALCMLNKLKKELGIEYSIQYEAIG